MHANQVIETDANHALDFSLMNHTPSSWVMLNVYTSFRSYNQSLVIGGVVRDNGGGDGFRDLLRPPLGKMPY